MASQNSRGFRLNSMRGQLRTKILEHLSLWESAHVNAEYIRELSHPSKLKNKGSLQASRIEALAIAFWSQKAKVPLEECCHDDKMVTQMAKSIYFFQRKINKMDNKMFRKISLHWHDIFPSWIPTIKGFVKLITLASGVAGRAIMNARPIEEAQNEFKALIATIPPASEPTAAMLDGVLKRWQEQRSKSDPGTLGGLSELGAALEEESNADMAMDNNDDDEVLEDEESVAEGPKLCGDLVFRPAPSR